MADPTGDSPGPVLVRVQPAERRRPLAVAAVIAAAVLSLAAWGALGGDDGREPAPSPEVVATASPRGTVVEPTPGMPATGTGLELVLEAAGWAPCPVWIGYGWGARADPAAVDARLAAIAEADPLRHPVTPSLVDTVDRAGRPVLVWVGDGPETAARAFGGSPVLHGTDDTDWTLLDGDRVAGRLETRATPGGVPYWELAFRALPMPWCDPGRSAAAGPATPTVPVSDVELLESRRGGSERIAIHEGWIECGVWTRYVTGRLPTGEAVDRAALAAGRDEGWVDVPVPAGDLRAWLGGDVGAMAAAHGSRLVTLGRREDAAWVLVTVDGHDVAAQLVRLVTPGGLVAWLPTANASGPGGRCTAEAPSEELVAQPAASLGSLLVFPGVPDEPDPLLDLVDLVTGAPCSSRLDLAPRVPTRDASDLSARAAAMGEGWVQAGGGSIVWVGESPVPLAVDLESQAMALAGPDEAWMLVERGGATFAVQQRRRATESGRFYWLEHDRIRLHECPADGS
jgi:hypothetical protein